MADEVERFTENPLITPADVAPSMPGLKVDCVLNPGAFRYKGRTGLLLRVAESGEGGETELAVPILDPDTPGRMTLRRFCRDDPELDLSDPRIFTYRGETYLSTLSHLRLAWSTDGVHFDVEDRPAVLGTGSLERFGVEDCRVTRTEGRYVLTYTAVSPAGVGIGLAETTDWQHYTRHGMVFCPDNKDGAVFSERVGGRYWALHRPSNVHIKGHHIWLAESPDLVHWGRHRCIAMTRPSHWDSARIGAGAAPIRTDHGWLAIYHGADRHHRYCLGALLLDLNDPGRVLARSDTPLMEPSAPYERKGFFGEVVFTNGHVVDGDSVTIYYGASDSVVCGAHISLDAILSHLG